METISENVAGFFRRGSHRFFHRCHMKGGEKMRTIILALAFAVLAFSCKNATEPTVEPSDTATVQHDPYRYQPTPQEYESLSYWAWGMLGIR